MASNTSTTIAFPFDNLENEDFVNLNDTIDVHPEYDKLPELILNQAKSCAKTGIDIEREIDPDENFYEQINFKCNYYAYDDVNKNVDSLNNLSLVHINARSLLPKLNDINRLLDQVSFDIVAISETWLTTQNCPDANLNNYIASHQIRQIGKGGGVSIYVKEDINYTIIENMTKSIDNLLECLTIELKLGVKGNKLVTVIYRKPGTNLEAFIEEMEKILSNYKAKHIILCGDFNIDLFKYNSNKGTSDFVNMFFAHGIVPLINKPTRITLDNMTLIDNIFTDNLNINTNSGIIISDISDHLPVFTVFTYTRKKEFAKKHIVNRKIDDKSISNLTNELQLCEWRTVLETDNANDAYDNFIDIFSKLLNKHCPLQQKIINTSKALTNLWLTNGLKNACRKKDYLYKQYILVRTDEALHKYKIYKNKLTSILRKAEKAYYNKRLINNKNDIRNTWKILNTIIRKQNNTQNSCEIFKINNVEVKDKTKIANGFNDYFANIGPTLAKDIPLTNDGIEMTDFLRKSNANSLFLNKVEQSEILNIVQNLKNKTSFDADNINMKIIKKSNIIHNRPTYTYF